ncbi:MAG: RtcB family protein [Desulfovibrio sp.]|jgi:tRNA-splicing ligase RtcB|nr:RtcB family protein [Desulfovibrio sp.]
MPLQSTRRHNRAKAYIADMTWAMDFAADNRMRMLMATASLLGFDAGDIEEILRRETSSNLSHNHALALPRGRVLHRKGAIPAERGQMGVIPANQRDGVWVAKGLGNAEFLASASHGAGRKMARSQAAKKGDVHDLKKLMKGITCRIDRDVLDEAPWAYKRIDDVLAAQEGVLVEIIDHFSPIVVLKGGN